MSFEDGDLLNAQHLFINRPLHQPFLRTNKSTLTSRYVADGAPVSFPWPVKCANGIFHATDPFAPDDPESDRCF